MRESRTYGSVRGARSNARPYRDRGLLLRKRRLRTRVIVVTWLPKANFTMDDAGEECVVIRNNVTLPRRTLRRLDDDARAAGETRSGYTAKLAIGR
jgi:hypothetical protein